MSYVRYENLLKKHQPKIYDELYTNTRQLSVEIIKRRMKKELDVYSFSQLLGLTPEEYLKYEYGGTEIEISEYCDLINKIDDLWILEFFVTKLKSEKENFVQGLDCGCRKLTSQKIFISDINIDKKNRKSVRKKRKYNDYSGFKSRNEVSMNEQYVQVR